MECKPVLPVLATREFIEGRKEETLLDADKC